MTKEPCKHKDIHSSSDPSIWYICHDCGAWLDNKFEVITEEKHQKIIKILKGEDENERDVRK